MRAERTLALILALVIVGPAREAGATADTVGEQDGQIRLGYMGSLTRRFFDGGGGSHRFPDRGNYESNEGAVSGVYGVFDFLDVNASLSAGEGDFFDHKKSDRTRDLDLDSVTFGAKARFLKIDPVSVAVEWLETIPVSTHTRELFYTQNAIASALKLEGTVHLPLGFYVSAYGGAQSMTAHFADLALVGVEGGVRVADTFAIYVPVDFETPIDHVGRTDVYSNRKLSVPSPTTLNVSLAASITLWRGLAIDGSIGHTFYGRDALVLTFWGAGVSYTF